MPSADYLLLSLLTPVKNEINGAENLWQSIVDQEHQPNEWILLDNGSDDGTFEFFSEKATSQSQIKVKILSLPGKTIAEMMNEGIRVASNDWIACCHAGTEISSNWLKKIVSPVLADSSIDVVGGVWQAKGETAFAHWYSQVIKLDLSKISSSHFLPASRSILFTKKAWEVAGGFPEWLPLFGEDTLFAIRLRNAEGIKMVINEDAIVGWYPKPTFFQILRQEKRYCEANFLLGLTTLDPNVLIRPWFALFLAVTMLPFSPLASILSFIGVILLDGLRLHLKRVRKERSFLMTLFSTWVMPLAWQWGYFSFLQFRNQGIQPPESDRLAVDAYLRSFH